MRTILSYHAFLFVWLNFQLDKSELGERKREVIPTAAKGTPSSDSLIGDRYDFFLTSAPVYITFKNGQKRGLTYSVDRSRLPNSHCLDVGGYCHCPTLQTEEHWP
jgi:hypothetical protein